MAKDEKVEDFDLTQEDINEFVTKKLLSQKCTSCKKNNWSLEGSWQDGSVLLYFQKRGEQLPEVQFVSCYALICIECGHVKTYAKYAVQLWKEKNKKKKKKKRRKS